MNLVTFFLFIERLVITLGAILLCEKAAFPVGEAFSLDRLKRMGEVPGLRSQIHFGRAGGSDG